MLTLIQRILRAAFTLAERTFDHAFGQRLNPFYHLGALSFLSFWIIAASGLYLYIFFETSISGAYQSIEELTHDQWYLGGIMRSLHRYASGAMVITAMLHMTREFSLDRYRGSHWYSWFTGVPLLWLLVASGISGYWLVWDQLAQFVAVISAEWLDWLPIFTDPMSRNFINAAAVSDRFFSLLAFLHVGIPLALLMLMFVHIQRMTAARSNPPKGLALGTLAGFLVLSLAWPALSQAPANLDLAVGSVDLDWFYLAIYPLVDRGSPALAWLVAAGVTTVVAILPWLPPRRRGPAAVVNLDNCNGCGRCFADCPYDAVTMQARSDGASFAEEAVVDDSLCARCGICVGACPTATPFRRASDLVAGIELPALTVHDLRERVQAKTEGLDGEGRVIVFSCKERPKVAESAGVVVVELPCVGMLPPPFVDLVLSRRMADGVLLAGCSSADCRYRFGNDWVDARVAGTRDPALRARVPRERVELYWESRAGRSTDKGRLQAFRDRLTKLGPYQRSVAAKQVKEVSDGTD